MTFIAGFLPSFGKSRKSDLERLVTLFSHKISVDQIVSHSQGQDLLQQSLVFDSAMLCRI
jgi:hypothetical protein